jgi:hypothetical protein
MGSAFSRTAFRNENTAVFAPMLKASERTATARNPGVRANTRQA